jgi:hypothetical protein
MILNLHGLPWDEVFHVLLVARECLARELAYPYRQNQDMLLLEPTSHKLTKDKNGLLYIILEARELFPTFWTLKRVHRIREQAQL